MNFTYTYIILMLLSVNQKSQPVYQDGSRVASLSASLDAPRYKIGTAINCQVVITNRSDEHITFFSSKYQFTPFSIDILDNEDGRMPNTRFLDECPHGAVQTVGIPPKKSRTFRFRLDTLKDLTFPDTYKLKLGFKFTTSNGPNSFYKIEDDMATFDVIEHE